MTIDILVADEYDLSLAKLNIIKLDRYWQKLAYMDSQRSILFPCNYHTSKFSNEDISFLYYKIKIFKNYDVAFKHLNEEWSLLKMDYILYHPNVLRNDVYIKHYQNHYLDFDIGKPKILLKKKTD